MNITSTIAGFAGLLGLLGLLLALALNAVDGRNRYANRILALFVALSSLYLFSLVMLHSDFTHPFWLRWLAGMSSSADKSPMRNSLLR